MIAYSTETRSPADLGRVLECLLASHPHAREVTRAVEAYVADQPGQSVPASECTLLHAARALASVGDLEGASAILAVTTQWAEWSGCVDLAGLDPATAQLLASGLVQAARSPVLGAGLLVKLDLRRIPAEGPALELIHVPLAYRLVDACQPLWRNTAGQGALVVQGWSTHLNTDPAGRTPGWFQQAFRDRLAWWAGRSGWPHAPWLVMANS